MSEKLMRFYHLQLRGGVGVVLTKSIHAYQAYGGWAMEMPMLILWKVIGGKNEQT